MSTKAELAREDSVGVRRDHEDRGGPEAGNLQQQFKNFEKIAFIFQIRNAAKS